MPPPLSRLHRAAEWVADPRNAPKVLLPGAIAGGVLGGASAASEGGGLADAVSKGTMAGSLLGTGALLLSRKPRGLPWAGNVKELDEITNRFFAAGVPGAFVAAPTYAAGKALGLGGRQQPQQQQAYQQPQYPQKISARGWLRGGQNKYEKEVPMSAMSVAGDYRVAGKSKSRNLKRLNNYGRDNNNQSSDDSDSSSQQTKQSEEQSEDTIRALLSGGSAAATLGPSLAALAADSERIDDIMMELGTETRRATDLKPQLKEMKGGMRRGAVAAHTAVPALLMAQPLFQEMARARAEGDVEGFDQARSTLLKGATAMAALDVVDSLDQFGAAADIAAKTKNTNLVNLVRRAATSGATRRIAGGIGTVAALSLLTGQFRPDEDDAPEPMIPLG